jgi:hypothetical protein
LVHCPFTDSISDNSDDNSDTGEAHEGSSTEQEQTAQSAFYGLKARIHIIREVANVDLC